MKAVVKFDQQPGKVELRDVPQPQAGPGTVLLEVKSVSVCGWDIEMWKHSMANPVTVPVIQGHEFCGVIAELGSGVDGWKTGERVACETSAVVCGQCRWCRAGNYNLCPDRKGYGYGIDGAFAKYVVARPAILHRIPESLSFDEAALTEPYCVVHHALTDRARIAPGDVVLVIGPGPIGLIALQMAKLWGAAVTIVAGMAPDGARLQLALDQGWADRAVRVEKENLAEVVNALTAGQGADVVVDCAGNAPAVVAALDCVRREGQIVKIGWGPKPFNHSLDALLRKSASLSGTFGHNWHNWEAVLKLFATGRLKPRSLISRVMPLDQWHEAFELMEKCQAIKIVLKP